MNHKMEEMKSGCVFGILEEPITFLWNTVGRCSFYGKPNIHSDLWLSFPSLMPKTVRTKGLFGSTNTKN